MQIKYDFLEFTWEEEPRDCADEKCNRQVLFNSKCFINVKTNEIFCTLCGPCARYSWKKAMERGEDISEVNMDA